MNGLIQRPDTSVFDAWLASACMPPETVRSLLETFGGAEACFTAFSNQNEAFRNTVQPRFLRMLENNGTAENLKRTEELMDRHELISLHQFLDLTDGLQGFGITLPIDQDIDL